MAVSYAIEYRAYTAESVVKAMEESEKASKDAGSLLSAYTTQKTKANDEEKAVKSVIAGQDERLNWLALNRFISESLPRPDPTPPKPGDQTNKANLSYLAWSEFCDPLKPTNANVRNAFERFKTWRNLTATQASLQVVDRDDTWMQDLILDNIEAIDCRYTDNLTTFWDGLKNAPRFKDDIIYTIRPRTADGTEIKPPDGKGWVVELRGFTFHRDKKNFVLKSLVDNLADIGTGVRKPNFSFAPPAPVKPATPMPNPMDPNAPPSAPTVGPDGQPVPTASEVKHPVLGQISHVLLLQSETNPVQSLIAGTKLDTVMAGGAPTTAGQGGDGGMSGSPKGGGAPPNPMMPGMGEGGGMMAGGSKGGWVPLTGASFGGGGGYGGGGMMGGFGSGPPSPLMPRTGGGPMTGDGGMVGGTAGATDPTKKSLAPRTEFIVLFIWKEPTPSDELMMKAEGGTP